MTRRQLAAAVVGLLLFLLAIGLHYAAWRAAR